MSYHSGGGSTSSERSGGNRGGGGNNQGGRKQVYHSRAQTNNNTRTYQPPQNVNTTTTTISQPNTNRTTPTGNINTTPQTTVSTSGSSVNAWGNKFALKTNSPLPSSSPRSPNTNVIQREVKEKEEKGSNKSSNAPISDDDDFPSGLGKIETKSEQRGRRDNQQRQELAKQEEQRGTKVKSVHTQISKKGTISIDQINSSQATCSWSMTEENKTIDDVADDMKANGWNYNRSSPDMVVMNDGLVVTLDHRRIVAAKRAGLEEIPVNIHRYDENIPRSTAGRFKKLGTIEIFPATWGEAVEFRSGGTITKGLPQVTGEKK